MTDETNTDATPVDNTGDDIRDATPDSEPSEEPAADEQEPDTFPREVVEKLRQENGRYRQRAQQADAYAARLHTELVRATGRLADPTDLAFDAAHLDDPESLTAAVDELLERKPHLASRRPNGDIGQGNRGSSSESVGLLQILKQRT